MILTVEQLNKRLYDQLGVSIISIEPIQGGANSQVVRVVTSKKQVFLVKTYAQPVGDLRDRLGTEFSGLCFLWHQGIRSIPEPIFADKQNNFAVYSFIEGRTLYPAHITTEHLSDIVDFFVTLQSLINMASAKKISPASEACFTLLDYLKSVEQRFTKLFKVENHKPFTDFLELSLFPFWEIVKDYTINAINSLNISLNKSLTMDERTLSQSDVGFHNILCEEKSNRLIFIDFEYFGWDDPVKMMCDFILQPAKPLPIQYYPIFMDKILQSFPYHDKLIQRFKLIFLVLGIKWCLIILNPFLPERRQKLGNDNNLVLEQRLAKSKEKLSTIVQYYETQEFTQWV